MNFINAISNKFPKLKAQLKIAHINKTPNEFIKKALNSTVMYSLLMTILAFFVLDQANMSMLYIPLIFIALFALFLSFAFMKLKTQIKKRAHEMDREVLYAGRYLLVKLYSGKPLLNALIETSKGYGVAAKYFREIVDDINTGTPIEKALDNIVDFSPSEKFRKILFQISNALKLGIDVTIPLENTIEEISKEQVIEIKRYGRKLNSIVIFYMLLAVVMPSLGVSLLITVASFLNFSIGTVEFYILGFFIVIIQFLFISLFRSIRPNVNI